MNDESKTKMWEEIHRALQEKIHAPAEDERTVRQLSEEWKIKKDRAYTIVNQLVDAGVLLKRRDGSLIYVRPNPDVENVTKIIQEKLFQ